MNILFRKGCIIILFLLISHISSLGMVSSGDSLLIKNPKNESDSIKQVIQNYYASSDAEQIAEYIICPDSLKNIMNNYFAENNTPTIIAPENIFIIGSNFRNGDYIKSTIQRKIGKRKLYLYKTEQGLFKIDVIASYGLNKTSLVAFTASGDTTTKGFRLEITLANFYYDDFFYNNIAVSKENLYSFRIYDINRSSSAWVEKNSETGKKLFEICQDGASHRVFLLIKNVEFNTEYGQQHGKKGEDGIIIRKLVQEDWIKVK